jgi:hypothetical protein
VLRAELLEVGEGEARPFAPFRPSRT